MSKVNIRSISNSLFSNLGSDAGSAFDNSIGVSSTAFT